MAPWEFNFRHLRAFSRVAALGSLVAASRSVHISQPALTQAIAGLEKMLGVTLFTREPDGMKPSEAAHLFRRRVDKALSLIAVQKLTQAQARAFTALARGGSYADASETTGLAKASLHRCVRDLEIIVGQELVRRVGRGLELTERGRALARRINLAYAELASGIAELQALAGLETERIAIGAMPLCRARVLPESIVAYQETRPDSTIYVAEGSHAELIEPLRDGELDFLIGALRDHSLGRDLIQEPLFDDLPVVIARADHPLFKRRTKLTLKDLQAFDWCVPPEGVPLRERWQDLFLESGLSLPKIRVECGSVIAIRQILMKTSCLTLLSPDQVAVELEAKWLGVVFATPPQFTRTIGLTYRADWRPTASQRDFIEVLKSVCQN